MTSTLDTVKEQHWLSDNKGRLSKTCLLPQLLPKCRETDTKSRYRRVPVLPVQHLWLEGAPVYRFQLHLRCPGSTHHAFACDVGICEGAQLFHRQRDPGYAYPARAAHGSNSRDLGNCCQVEKGKTTWSFSKYFFFFSGSFYVLNRCFLATWNQTAAKFSSSSCSWPGQFTRLAKVLVNCSSARYASNLLT